MLLKIIGVCHRLITIVALSHQVKRILVKILTWKTVLLSQRKFSTLLVLNIPKQDLRLWQATVLLPQEYTISRV